MTVDRLSNFILLVQYFVDLRVLQMIFMYSVGSSSYNDLIKIVDHVTITRIQIISNELPHN